MTELAVLVPVLNRPQNVAPLVESFRANCPSEASIVFIVSFDDKLERKAIQAEIVTTYVARDDQLNMEMMFSEGDSWPLRINQGVANRPADWYLCAADDIRFTPGWWEATKELRDDESIGVIGTNDSTTGAGNPRVLQGEHTCHPLVRRSYIEARGTIDTPGKAVHDGYSHWCVDDELIWTARLRSAWAYCGDAVIEHLHPYWNDGKGWDATYAQGEANAEADMALWRDRAVRLLGLQVQ